MNADIPLSPRLVLLFRQAHAEEGVPEEEVPEPNAERRIAIYPRSFVTRVERIGWEKTRDFNFRGALYIDPNTRRNREWVLAFAREHFTQRSFFQATDRRIRSFGIFKRHGLLGDFDHTYSQTGFVPKEKPKRQRDFFDEDYFRILCGSQFTLCPAGDRPWSMRFYESILCRSIPILEKPEHSGRNPLEYSIGYKFFLLGDQLEYRADWVEENASKFRRHQTLIEGAAAAGST